MPLQKETIAGAYLFSYICRTIIKIKETEETCYIRFRWNTTKYNRRSGKQYEPCT